MSGTLYEQAGRQHNIDPLLLRAIAAVESGENDDIPDSRAGAQGRMQFMPGTAAAYGVANRRDPNQAIPGAAKLLNDLLNQYQGDPVKALKAYNAGAPSRWNNPETNAYVGKVAAAYERLKGATPAMAQAQPPADDFSDILALPTKGAAAPAAKEDDYSDILSLPTKGAPDPVRTNADVLRAAGMAGQEVRTATGPIAESLGQPVAGDRVPGAVTQAAASMATDPEQRRRIMASQLFPGLPLKEALARITTGPGGRMMAVDMQNRPFYIEPETIGRGDVPIYEQNLRAITPGYLAQGIGASLPVAGGVAGGLLASPTSMVMGPGLAAAGAAVGDAARQGVASMLDPGSLPYDYAQTAREAALAGAGQLAGAGVARMAAPNALMVPASDIRLARTGAVLPQAQAAFDRAGAQGVALTPGQASALPSLISFEDVAKSTPGLMDQAGRFYQAQGQQLQGAGNRLLDMIAPSADKVDSALQFQQGAESAIRGVRQQANALARPQFQAAEAGGQVMSPDLAQLMETPAVRDAMARARVVYENKYGKPPESPDFRLWQETKHVLDDAYSAAQRNADSSAGRAVASGIDSVRQRFISALDDAYPTYGAAREIAEPGHRLAGRLEDTATGKIAGKTGDETARPLVAPMFENTNPAGIKTAREAFETAGQTDAWNQGVRAYLQDAIDKASTSQEGLNAALLRRKVWSNSDVRTNLQAAMTPDQFKGFENFLGTVEDIARTMPLNSLTFTRGQASSALAGAAGNTPANKLVRGIGMAGSPATFWRGIQVVTDPLDAWITGRNVRSVVDNLFSPDGMQMLTDMARVAPGTNRARAAALQILSRGTPDLPAASGATGQPAPQPTNLLTAPR